MNRILALWAVPRSVSTAFERMMMERGDFFVFHEPFSASYYYGEGRPSRRYAHVAPEARHAPAVVLEGILARAEAEPVFVKDMATHVIRLADAALLERFEHSFLIRDPSRALPSFFHKWPDLTEEEAGFPEIHGLFRKVREATGEIPPVVDADDLLEAPERIVRAWCDRMGIPFLPEAMAWEPSSPPEWRNWDTWHDDAEKSRGFRAGPRKAYTPVSGHPRLAELHEACLPHYRALHRHRLGASEPVPTTG